MSNVCQMCGQCMANVWQVYVKCMANVWQMYGKCTADVWQMYVKCMANVWKIYGKFIANVCQMYGKCMSNVCQMYLSNVCHVKCMSMYVTYMSISFNLRTERVKNVNVRCCFTDSNSLVDDTDAEFRSRVEKIRQIGGDSWLKIFGEIQGEEEMTQVRARFIITRSDVNSLVNGEFFFLRAVEK